MGYRLIELSANKNRTFRVFFLLSTLASYISMLITVNILASLFAHSRLELISDSGICEQIKKRSLFKEDHTACTEKKSYSQNAVRATVLAPAQSLVALCLDL